MRGAFWNSGGLWFARLGISFGLWLGGACAGPLPPPGGWTAGTVWLAADRDGDALIELDRDLFVIGRRTLASPLWVRGGGGRLWVVHAPAGAPGAPLALRCWGASGPGPARTVGEVLDLEVDGRGRALVLERGPSGGVRLLRYDADGGVCDLAAPPEARALALGPHGLAVALDGAGWAEAGPTAEWRVRAGLDGARVIDLAPRAGGGWWTLARLDGEPQGLCVGLDRDGVPRELHPVGAARALARRTRAPWAWQPDERPVRGPDARPWVLSMAGARAAVGDDSGGLVVAAAGALLRLGPGGTALPGQGGFARLVDLESLGGFSAPP